MRGDLRVMGNGIREEMKVGQKELKAELVKVKEGQQSLDVGLVEVKGEIQRMEQRMADDIKMVREEMNGMKGNVEGVWTAMKTDKDEVINKITG